MSLQTTIYGAIEDELFDCGCSADDRVDEIFELLRKALVPNMSYSQFDLVVADARRVAEEKLAGYVLIDLETTSEAIVDALVASKEQS
jgi:hypothetical protein